MKSFTTKQNTSDWPVIYTSNFSDPKQLSDWQNESGDWGIDNSKEAGLDSSKVQAMLAAKQYPGAIVLARKLTQQVKPRAEDWFNLASAAWDLAEVEEAIRAAKKAAEMDEKNYPLPDWAKR